MVKVFVGNTTSVAAVKLNVVALLMVAAATRGKPDFLESFLEAMKEAMNEVIVEETGSLVDDDAAAGVAPPPDADALLAEPLSPRYRLPTPREMPRDTLDAAPFTFDVKATVKELLSQLTVEMESETLLEQFTKNPLEAAVLVEAKNYERLPKKMAGKLQEVMVNHVRSGKTNIMAAGSDLLKVHKDFYDLASKTLISLHNMAFSSQIKLFFNKLGIEVNKDREGKVTLRKGGTDLSFTDKIPFFNDYNDFLLRTTGKTATLFGQNFKIRMESGYSIIDTNLEARALEKFIQQNPDTKLSLSSISDLYAWRFSKIFYEIYETMRQLQALANQHCNSRIAAVINALASLFQDDRILGVPRLLKNIYATMNHPLISMDAGGKLKCDFSSGSHAASKETDTINQFFSSLSIAIHFQPFLQQAQLLLSKISRTFDSQPQRIGDGKSAITYRPEKFRSNTINIADEALKKALDSCKPKEGGAVGVAVIDPRVNKPVYHVAYWLVSVIRDSGGGNKAAGRVNFPEEALYSFQAQLTEFQADFQKGKFVIEELKRQKITLTQIESAFTKKLPTENETLDSIIALAESDFLAAKKVASEKGPLATFCKNTLTGLRRGHVGKFEYTLQDDGFERVPAGATPVGGMIGTPGTRDEFIKWKSEFEAKLKQFSKELDTSGLIKYVRANITELAPEKKTTFKRLAESLSQEASKLRESLAEILSLPLQARQALEQQKSTMATKDLIKRAQTLAASNPVLINKFPILQTFLHISQANESMLAEGLKAENFEGLSVERLRDILVQAEKNNRDLAVAITQLEECEQRQDLIEPLKFNAERLTSQMADQLSALKSLGTRGRKFADSLTKLDGMRQGIFTQLNDLSLEQLQAATQKMDSIASDFAKLQVEIKQALGDLAEVVDLLSKVRSNLTLINNFLFPLAQEIPSKKIQVELEAQLKTLGSIEVELLREDKIPENLSAIKTSVEAIALKITEAKEVLIADAEAYKSNLIETLKCSEETDALFRSILAEENLTPDLVEAFSTLQRNYTEQASKLVGKQQQILAEKEWYWNLVKAKAIDSEIKQLIDSSKRQLEIIKLKGKLLPLQRKIEELKFKAQRIEARSIFEQLLMLERQGNRILAELTASSEPGKIAPQIETFRNSIDSQNQDLDKAITKWHEKFSKTIELAESFQKRLNDNIKSYNEGLTSIVSRQAFDISTQFLERFNKLVLPVLRVQHNLLASEQWIQNFGQVQDNDRIINTEINSLQQKLDHEEFEQLTKTIQEALEELDSYITHAQEIWHMWVGENFQKYLYFHEYRAFFNWLQEIRQAYGTQKSLESDLETLRGRAKQKFEGYEVELMEFNAAFRAVITTGDIRLIFPLHAKRSIAMEAAAGAEAGFDLLFSADSPLLYLSLDEQDPHQDLVNLLLKELLHPEIGGSSSAQMYQKLEQDYDELLKKFENQRVEIAAIQEELKRIKKESSAMRGVVVKKVRALNAEVQELAQKFPNIKKELSKAFALLSPNLHSASLKSTKRTPKVREYLEWLLTSLHSKLAKIPQAKTFQPTTKTIDWAAFEQEDFPFRAEVLNQLQKGLKVIYRASSELEAYPNYIKFLESLIIRANGYLATPKESLLENDLKLFFQLAACFHQKLWPANLKPFWAACLFQLVEKLRDCHLGIYSAVLTPEIVRYGGLAWRADNGFDLLKNRFQQGLQASIDCPVHLCEKLLDYCFDVNQWIETGISCRFGLHSFIAETSFSMMAVSLPAQKFYSNSSAQFLKLRAEFLTTLEAFIRSPQANLLLCAVSIKAQIKRMEKDPSLFPRILNTLYFSKGPSAIKTIKDTDRVNKLEEVQKERIDTCNKI